MTHVVALSSYGADKVDKTGPVAGLHVMEERFSQIPKLNALFLRAGYFMENVLAQVGIIKGFGMMAGPVRADLALPVIATHDIAMAAADALAKLDFSGHQTRELHGQRDLTTADRENRGCGDWKAEFELRATADRAGDSGDDADGYVEEHGDANL